MVTGLLNQNKFPRRKEPRKPESASHVTEFTGIVNHKTNHFQMSETNISYLFDKQKDNLLTLHIRHNREIARRIFYNNSKRSHHINRILDKSIRRFNPHNKTTLL